MEEYHIYGGNPICGEYTVKGAKNAVLPVLAASIIPGCESTFLNCPDISDAGTMKKILISLGCSVMTDGDVVTVDSRGLFGYRVPEDMMKEIRSSVFLVGPLLARCGKAVISEPGGCAIGKRPVDIHIKALKKLGVTVREESGLLICTADKMKGATIRLEFPSVGATENAMMAALGAEGTTVIKNSAREPEIEDLQDYLTGCGARIKGAGTDTITVEGKAGAGLTGCVHIMISDRIEGGTFLAAAAGTGGELVLSNIKPIHLRSVSEMLRSAGCKIREGNSYIYIKAPKRLRTPGKIVTAPYPGFPTDMQPQITALMSMADGKTQIKENIFENRFKFAKQLLKMGADIEIYNRKAIIKGVYRLCGNTVFAEDLRGGAALILAGLSAEGKTVIKGTEHIERGYCNIHKELCALGGEIWKTHEE